MIVDGFAKTILAFLLGGFIGAAACLFILDKRVDDIVEHQSLLGRSVFLGNILADIAYMSKSNEGVVTCSVIHTAFFKHSNLLVKEAEEIGVSKIPMVDHGAYARSLVEKTKELESNCRS